MHSTLRLWAMRLLYGSAEQIIALTSVMKNDLANLTGISERKIVVIANPVDSKIIRHQANEKCMELERFVNRPYVLSIGRLTKQKDLHTVIRAIELVNQKHPLLGPGNYR